MQYEYPNICYMFDSVGSVRLLATSDLKSVYSIVSMMKENVSMNCHILYVNIKDTMWESRENYYHLNMIILSYHLNIKL